MATPADAFFAVFCAGTEDVRITAAAVDTAALTRIAAAMRSGRDEAAAWCRRELGWDAVPAQDLTQAFALVTGEWLLGGSGETRVLRRELGLAWRAFGEADLH